jgi:hypothetical protein
MHLLRHARNIISTYTWPPVGIREAATVQPKSLFPAHLVCRDSLGYEAQPCDHAASRQTWSVRIQFDGHLRSRSRGRGMECTYKSPTVRSMRRSLCRPKVGCMKRKSHKVPPFGQLCAAAHGRQKLVWDMRLKMRPKLVTADM